MTDLGRRGEGTADRLAGIALELFNLKGFDETTVDEIAIAAGVSRRTFFRYFPRKEAVILFEQTAIQAELRARLEARTPGVSALDQLIAGARDVLRAAEADPERLALRSKLIDSVPELASIERDSDAQTVGIFAAAYAEELGGRPADRVRAMSVGSAIVAAANAALVACLSGDDALDLFDDAASRIKCWEPDQPTRSVVAVLRVSSTLSDEEVVSRLSKVRLTPVQ